MSTWQRDQPHDWPMDAIFLQVLFAYAAAAWSPGGVIALQVVFRSQRSDSRDPGEGANARDEHRGLSGNEANGLRRSHFVRLRGHQDKGLDRTTRFKKTEALASVRVIEEIEPRFCEI